MSEPYLIAHLVRSKPAFDIAIRMDCCVCHADPNVVSFVVPATTDCTNCDGLGYDWMIPTSGHRAYPFWHTPLEDFAFIDNGHVCCDNIFVDFPIPTDWPDHYTTYATPRTGLITNLAERLGFVPKPTVITRR